ncbi:bifunctional ornithine acetyltransferase/N-acetylglutamate synthase [Cystobacter fuscus]
MPCPSLEQFESALERVCADLAEDPVRNGEGVHHVMRVRVHGAPDEAVARGIGKSVVNSPLFQCAVNGNDPNVGRLVMAIGKYVGAHHPGMDLSRCTLRMGGRVILQQGTFRLDHEAERALVAHMKEAELYASVAPADGLTFQPPVTWPRTSARWSSTWTWGSARRSARCSARTAATSTSARTRTTAADGARGAARPLGGVPPHVLRMRTRRTL